jgi:GAF domain-containing protein
MSLDLISAALERLDAACSSLDTVLNEPLRLAEADRILANFTGNALIEQMVRECAQRLGVEQVAVTVLTDKTQKILVSVTPMEEVDRVESYCQFVAGTGEPLMIPDSRKRKGFLARLPAGYKGSYLGVPVLAHQQQLGALCSLDAKPRAWSASDLALMQAYSVQISAVLEEADL